MQTVNFAPWEPDKAAIHPNHATEAMGVLPVASGYGPFPSFLERDSIDPLPDDFRGAYSFFDRRGAPATIVGTRTGLYQLKIPSWAALGDGYTPTPYPWNFARYGEMIIAVNGMDRPVYAMISGGEVGQFQEIADAPVARSVDVVKEFVMLGGVDVTKVRWSAIGNPLDWPAPGSNDAQYKQADEQDFPDTGSLTAVSGALPGIDVVLFTERAVHRGQYIGSPLVFQFDIIDKTRGALSASSVVTGRNAIYYLSEEGFFATNGASVQNISAERVVKWFRKHCDLGRRPEIRGVLDQSSGFILWTFPSAKAPRGMNDHFIVYNPVLDRWSYGKQEIVGIFARVSDGYRLEELNQFGPLDTLEYSLDDPYWKGGFYELAGITQNGRFGTFSGLPMEALLETSEIGGKRMMLHGIRPLVDGGNIATASMVYRNFQHETPTAKACDTPSRFNGVCYSHVSTRYVRARVHIPYGRSWTHAVGCDFLSEDEGAI